MKRRQTTQPNSCQPGETGLGNWILDTLIGQRPADRVEGGQAVFDGLPADASHVLHLTPPTPPAAAQ